MLFSPEVSNMFAFKQIGICRPWTPKHSRSTYQAVCLTHALFKTLIEFVTRTGQTICLTGWTHQYAVCRISFWIKNPYCRSSWKMKRLPSGKRTQLWKIFGWWFGTFFIFPYIGNNHPNWLSYFSEGWPNHQPETFWVFFEAVNFPIATSCYIRIAGNINHSWDTTPYNSYNLNNLTVQWPFQEPNLLGISTMPTFGAAGCSTLSLNSSPNVAQLQIGNTEAIVEVSRNDAWDWGKSAQKEVESMVCLQLVYGLSMVYLSQMLHGAGIFTYIWVIFGVSMLVNIPAPWVASGIGKPLVNNGLVDRNAAFTESAPWS